MSRTGVVVLLVACAAAAIGAARARVPSGVDQRFIGTWRLVSIVNIPPEARGEHSTGLIYYDATGHMAAQIMPERPRSKYAGLVPTPDEAKVAITGYTAYFGTYTVDARAGIVRHHREGSIEPGQVGVDAVRRFEFVTPDTLVLTPIDEPDRHLTWQRLR